MTTYNVVNPDAKSGKCEMWLTGDLEEIWYKMKEPDGKVYDWDHAFQAIDFCSRNDFSCIWRECHNKNFECYTPKIFTTEDYQGYISGEYQAQCFAAK